MSSTGIFRGNGLGHSTRDAPAFNSISRFIRSSRWCVVIPVINEGYRLVSLLKKMGALDIAGQADIVIVDGGSSDGSLDTLQQEGVRTLLVKTGRGRLGAQLRCAYAYAMEQGYDGVITIDGNDKDDPSAIPAFITALEQGYDFVQGSRFIPGGVAENTPLYRNVAIRYIHAPLLSLCSGFKWTDTTQGFRAYSRRLIQDVDMALFRSVFVSYELLAYVSYRAPKLGHRCIEIATARRYPAGGVPTKINGLLGNLDLLRVLLFACMGWYNPPWGRRNDTRRP